MSFINFPPIVYKETITRIESDKAKKCVPQRVQKAWIWVKYIHFYDDKCVVIQIYPTLSKRVIKYQDD